jgi:Protein of unknown function (DUF3105)
LPRLLVVLLGVVVAAAGLIGLVLVLAARDDSQLAAAPAGPGELQPDRGADHLPAGDVADSVMERLPEDLPTSGPHAVELVTRDRRALTTDQIIHALELGNVVILYAGDEPAAALERLQEDVAGPFDAELAAAGQSVILAPAEGAGAATALAWRRVLRAGEPNDPALREFTEHWLGRGLQP